MKFSGKMCLMIILIVKKTGLQRFSKKRIFGKTTMASKIDPLVFLGLKVDFDTLSRNLDLTGFTHFK